MLQIDGNSKHFPCSDSLPFLPPLLRIRHDSSVEKGGNFVDLTGSTNHRS